ncbi:MAG: hypothetical protein NVS4B11_13620 [Ktedonobacteraceae bacterium]
MTNNTLPTHQGQSASPTDIEMDDVVKRFKKSKSRITLEYDRTGNRSKISREFPGKKTVGDWIQFLLQLAIIPGVLLVASSIFSDRQNQTNNTIAHNVQQQAILKTYLDDMSNLLLSTSIATPQLLQATTNDEITKVAQAKTEIALKSLDPGYKADVMTFLYKADLINWHNFDLTQKKSAFPLIKLDYDDLKWIDLSGVFMDNVDIHNTFLDNAKMNGSILVYGNLSISSMQNVNLSKASLHGSDLTGTDLTGANLSDTLLNCNPIAVNSKVFDFKSLNVCPFLQGVNFTGATMKHTHLQGVDLSSANLTNANLSDALLNCITVPKKGGTSYCVNLRGVDLSSATLNGADLSGANLQGAKVDISVLEKVAKSLHGTIMPDGTIHA